MNVRFERISLEDDLSQTSVACAQQDRDGFMGFGTREGLNQNQPLKESSESFRYDLADATSPSRDRVRAIAEDGLAPLWLAACFGVLGMARFQTHRRRRAKSLLKADSEPCTEIEERQRKEHELGHERKKAQTFPDVAEVLMVELDTEGQVRLINQKGAHALGYAEGEIIGQNWHELIVPPKVRHEVRRYLSNPESNQYFQYPVTTRSGDQRLIAWHTIYLTDEEGALTGTLSSGSDLTQMRREREAKELAESANRATSQFLADMIHEIRPPMHGVLGMADLLLSTNLDSRQRRFVDTIMASANNLLKLSNEILEFSKIESGRIHLASLEFDLPSMVEETVEVLSEGAFRKGLDMACWIDPDVAANVVGDPSRLRQVLLNLIGKAVKLTELGEIVVSVSPLEKTPGSNLIRFEVRGTGTGVDPSQRKALFEVHEQGDASCTREHGGSGPDLAISRRLVELMGGDMDVVGRSEEGPFFRFTARLKAGAGSRDRSEGCRQMDSIPVLIVDPSPTWQEILGQYLQSLGARVEKVATGSAALRAVELAASAEQPFQLVVAEQRLPDGSAAELARWIDDSGGLPYLPLIVLTPWLEAPDPARLAKEGLAGCVTKPIAQIDLETAVLRVLGQSQQVSRNAGADSSRTGGTVRFSCRVLLAEDNQVDQQLAIEMLRSMGFEVCLAEDGLRALAAATSEVFDLILMDCQMPKMDGFEATRAIRREEAESQADLPPQHRRRVPIVALTAEATQEARGQCLDAGMNAYLHKPFDQTQLSALLAQWLPEPALDRSQSHTDPQQIVEPLTRRVS